MREAGRSSEAGGWEEGPGSGGGTEGQGSSWRDKG